MGMTLDRWDYYELIDEIGQSYYRWDAELEMMEWWCGEDGWRAHGWTPGSLLRYAETYDDANVTVVTEDDVR